MMKSKGGRDFRIEKSLSSLDSDLTYWDSILEFISHIILYNIL